MNTTYTVKHIQKCPTLEIKLNIGIYGILDAETAISFNT